MPAARVGLSPILMATTALAWVSAVIVMGILAYFFSISTNRGEHMTYELVVSVLTVALGLAGLVLGAYAGFFMLFNLIFSYLWIVVVAFTASEFTYADSALLHTVEAFSFIAFFLLLFNVLYDWHFGYRVHARGHHTTTTARV